jgi:WS/DGAT/MGAT family acyltransferase
MDGGELAYEPRMSASDALMWCIEKDPLLRSTITSIMVLDQAPHREHLEARLKHLVSVIPRLRQRVVGHTYSIAPPRWEDDPNFDLSFHVRWMRAPGAGTVREVFDIAEPIAMQGFDRARPLWEFVVIEGLDDGRAAVVQKIHHAITDGVGGIRIQMELLDLARADAAVLAPVHPPSTPTSPPLSEAQRVTGAVGYETRRAIDSVRRLATSARSTVREHASDPVGLGTSALDVGSSLVRMLQPATEPLSPIMTRRSLSVRFDCLTLDLAAMKGAAKVVGGKLNDAFVAGAANGLRRYHLAHGHEVTELRMTMPISIRNEHTAAVAGNQFVPARFTVPIGIDDPVALMTEVRERIASQRGEAALSLTEPIASILSRLPTTATTAVFGALLKGIDFVTTNVPGPPVPVYVAGARVERQYAFAPMTGAAANIALLSCENDLNVGINTDPAAVPDPDVFVQCLSDGFDEIAAYA